MCILIEDTFSLNVAPIKHVKQLYYVFCFNYNDMLILMVSQCYEEDQLMYGLLVLSPQTIGW